MRPYNINSPEMQAFKQAKVREDAAHSNRISHTLEPGISEAEKQRRLREAELQKVPNLVELDDKLKIIHFNTTNIESGSHHDKHRHCLFKDGIIPIDKILKIINILLITITRIKVKVWI
jgi:hypothetical protein